MGGPRAVEPFRGRFGQKFPMRQRDSAYGQGPVTAIVASELDRDRLWEAIQARRTYATSGARIYLAVTSGRASADGEAALEGGLDLSIRCHACAPLARVDLIVGERRLRTWQPDGLDFREDLKLGSEDLPGDWIYVRVEQRDGEYAWSSPMFLKRSGPLPPGGHLPGWNEDGAEPDHEGQEEAARHLADLLRYLDREEDPERFREIRPAGMLDHSAGRCALFYCTWGERRMPMSIRWFHEFDIPRIRYDLGHRDYGACDEMDLGPELMARYRHKE
jgi:hypothetical protein